MCVLAWIFVSRHFLHLFNFSNIHYFSLCSTTRNNTLYQFALNGGFPLETGLYIPKLDSAMLVRASFYLLFIISPSITNIAYKFHHHWRSGKGVGHLQRSKDDVVSSQLVLIVHYHILLIAHIFSLYTLYAKIFIHKMLFLCLFRPKATVCIVWILTIKNWFAVSETDGWTCGISTRVYAQTIRIWLMIPLALSVVCNNIGWIKAVYF